MSDVFWIKGNPSVSLAIVLCPLGYEDLFGELLRVQEQRVETLVSLLEPGEARLLGLAEEGSMAHQIGLEFLSFPLPDHQVPPDSDSLRAFVAGLSERIGDGERVGIHCRGSIGRATVIAACTLMHLGWPAKVALSAIEEARGCPVPDTQKQENWIMRYKAAP